MARSLDELQTLLAGIEDVADAYLQPPTSGMQYPCIKYERGDPSAVSFADNVKYAFKKAYTVTVIDRDPKSLIPDRVEALPHCRYQRFYRTEGLNHFVFQLYF